MHDQQDEEDDEQHIGDVHRQTGHATSAESAGDQRQYEKNKGPTKHSGSFQSG
jgi:hypothetical protein